MTREVNDILIFIIYRNKVYGNEDFFKELVLYLTKYEFNFFLKKLELVFLATYVQYCILVHTVQYSTTFQSTNMNLGGNDDMIKCKRADCC